MVSDYLHSPGHSVTSSGLRYRTDSCEARATLKYNSFAVRATLDGDISIFVQMVVVVHVLSCITFDRAMGAEIRVSPVDGVKCRPSGVDGAE